MTKQIDVTKLRGYEDLGLYKLDGKPATGEPLETLEAAVRKVLETGDGALFVRYDPRDGAAVRLCRWGGDDVLGPLDLDERESTKTALDDARFDPHNPGEPAVLGRLLLTGTPNRQIENGSHSGTHIVFIGMNPSVAGWFSQKVTGQGGDPTAVRLRNIVERQQRTEFEQARAFTIVNLAPIVDPESGSVGAGIQALTDMFEEKGVEWFEGDKAAAVSEIEGPRLNALDRINFDMLAVLLAAIMECPEELVLVPMWGECPNVNKSDSNVWKAKRAPQVIRTLKDVVGRELDPIVIYVKNKLGTPKHLARASDAELEAAQVCHLSDLPDSACLREDDDGRCDVNP